MSESRAAKPKGPTTFDLLGMSDQDFETMTARLIRLEHPDAFKPANVKDGGADMVLRREAGGGYARCWQSKHYPKKMHWGKCEESLSDAREHWDPERYTFIFPRQLTFNEQKTFDEKFGDLDLEVDYWNGEELHARLTGSDEGERVARHFFDDPQLLMERTYQAIEAGGRLTDAEDAIDRMANLGAFLAGKDAYFSYPATTHEQQGPAPPLTPGAVMSVAKGDGQVLSRVDVVPRDAEAMERYGPEFVLQATDDDAGQKAARRLQEALTAGNAVQIDEGLDLTFTRMPPGLADLVGQRLTGGSIQLGEPRRVRRTVPPWDARLTATSPAGDATLDVQLTELADPPEGWDAGLVGTCGGLSVTALLRQVGEGGEMRWNFHYNAHDTSASEQLDALRFLRAMSGGGDVFISDRGVTNRPDLKVQTSSQSLPEGLDVMLTFLESLIVIEEWTGTRFTVPDTIDGLAARDAAIIAQLIRDGGQHVTWGHFEITTTLGQLDALRGGHVVRWEQALHARVLGRVVPLGYTQSEVTDFKLVSAEPEPGAPGQVRARIEPANEKSAKIFARLVKERTNAKRPPPPPPRKSGQRKRGGKKRGRKKR